MSEKNRSKLESVIRAAGLSQNQAAIECGVNPSQFKLYVRGSRPSKANAAKIAAALGEAVVDLWPELAGDAP